MIDILQLTTTNPPARSEVVARVGVRMLAASIIMISIVCGGRGCAEPAAVPETPMT